MSGERGAAIIVAMLVAALAAVVAMAIAAGQGRWLADVAARRDQVQAQSLAQAAVQWTRQIMFDDAAHGSIDFLGEPWALPLPPTPLENGTIEGRIVDAQGLFNLNNAGAGGARGDEQRATLGRLLARLGLPPAAADALADWVDADSEARAGGAEDPFYARLGYLAANGPLLRVAEAAAVRGLDEAAVARLAPYVAALPAETPINVNTAPQAVLAAALPGLADTAIAKIAAERAERPYTSVTDFRNRLPPGAAIGDERTFDVASSFFLVTVRARQGDAVAQARALLRRAPGGWPTVVWQTLE